nr:phosphomannomutase [bacterium]
CAEFLKIESPSIPVSCNTAVEKYGKFKRVNRTKIGSPFVIEDMILSNQKYSSVAGYEANGGFLLGSDAALNGKILKALPTRDAVLPIISVLIYAKEKKIRISELADLLPERYTYSGLLRNFPVEKSVEIIDYFKERPEVAANIYFESLNEKLSSVDYTDGCRITFESGRIIHLRPSGNAPEFRCYTETESEQLSKILNEKVLSVIKNKK